MSYYYDHRRTTLLYACTHILLCVWFAIMHMIYLTFWKSACMISMCMSYGVPSDITLLSYSTNIHRYAWHFPQLLNSFPSLPSLSPLLFLCFQFCCWIRKAGIHVEYSVQLPSSSLSLSNIISLTLSPFLSLSPLSPLLFLYFQFCCWIHKAGT